MNLTSYRHAGFYCCGVMKYVNCIDDEFRILIPENIPIIILYAVLCCCR